VLCLLDLSFCIAMLCLLDLHFCIAVLCLLDQQPVTEPVVDDDSEDKVPEVALKKLGLL